MNIAAIKEDDPKTISKIRDAFELFENQSVLLQDSYEDLKKNLAASNEELNKKNLALSGKVKELQQMSSRLQCILESLADGVLVIDKCFNIERVNPAAETLLKLEKGNIEGCSYERVVNGLGDTDVLEASLKHGKTCLDEERSCLDRNGDEITVLASVAPIRSHDGSILGAVEVLRDVSELRNLQDRVNCQKRMAALGEMAASVAHEIRNPLGTIEGFARLLKRDVSEQPGHLRLASKIVEGVQNLNYVITNLLTYARPMTVQCEAFSVGAFLSDVKDLLADRALREGVEVVMDETEEDLTLNADIRQLRQVVLNIGLNAIEACAERKNDPEKEEDFSGCVCLSALRKEKKIVVTVKDNGSGISKTEKRKIFDPFFTTKQGGTGLGLSLCHKIVSVHGGKIIALTSEKAGTTFEITIPVNENLEMKKK